jgi:hypothetical protein
VGGSLIANNTYAWQTSTGGTIRSYGNNQFSDNANSSGSLTSILLQ